MSSSAIALKGMMTQISLLDTAILLTKNFSFLRVYYITSSFGIGDTYGELR